MNDRDKKDIAEIVALAFKTRSRLEPHLRPVTAGECNTKHGEVLTKLEAVHTDVLGHLSWHNGIREEKSGEYDRINQKWAKAGTVAKWAAVILTISITVGSCVWGVAKISALAEEVAQKVNGYESPKNP
jgi:hypothetical protein